MRTLALPKEGEHWSLTALREKLLKIGAKVVSHGRYVTFQLAEVAVPSELFRKAEAENLSNHGALWVTSPWKPSYLGYIGQVACPRSNVPGRFCFE